MAAAVGAGGKSRLSRLLRERVGVVHNPEVEEKEVTCTIKVSIVFPSSCGPEVAQAQAPLKLKLKIYMSDIWGK